MSGIAAGPRRLTGEAASPGLLAGRIVTLRTLPGSVRRAGAPTAEKAALSAAIAKAVEELSLLMADAEDEDATEILAFQVAMLEDEALSEEAFLAIAEGVAADAAWRTALDRQVADYRLAEDAYFRARSSDLADLRDRVLQALAGGDDAGVTLPPGTILLAHDLTPSRFLSQDWGGCGIALEAGSASSHVAMLARARGVPMVLGLGPVAPATGASALLDAESGLLVLDPDELERQAFERRLADHRRAVEAQRALLTRPAVTAGGEAVTVMLNLASTAELADLDPAVADGVGLVRSEFLFHGRHGLPDEEEQLQAYVRILEWADGRPVVVRTLDAGGDKPIPGLTGTGETNPFLGCRGIRLSLARPEVFTVQLRALLRAAAVGPLKVMLPMVAQPQEVAQTRRLVQAAAAALQAEGREMAVPPLGIMVEVPAAALTLERFAIDFASIGSNDLCQYTMAAARDGVGLGHLLRSDEPAVLRLVEEVVTAGGRMGIPVSLCGDAGGDPRMIPALLATGLRSLSMAPPAIGRAKAAVAAWHAHG